MQEQKQVRGQRSKLSKAHLAALLQAFLQTACSKMTHNMTYSDTFEMWLLLAEQPWYEQTGAHLAAVAEKSCFTGSSKEGLSCGSCCFSCCASPCRDMFEL
jgi:hypothetical protein